MVEGASLMGRNRTRKSGEGLLPRMFTRPWADGETITYRYMTREGKALNLGTDKTAAIRAVLDLDGKSDTFGTVAWVWEKYQASRRFTRLAQDTRTDYVQCSIQILRVFGAVPISAIKSTHVAKYVRVERAGAPVRANREKSLLSNLFACGIDHGVCTENPAKLVRPNEEEPRTEAPSEIVLAKFLDWLNKQTPQRRIIGMAAQYASLAGNRKVEFLDLVWPQVDLVAGVIRIKRAKQRGKLRGEVIEEVAISQQLGELLGELKALNRECLYVFPTRDNNAYTARGFKTLWHRCVLAAIEENVLTPATRFTFHDLRAYFATVYKDRTGDLPELHKNPATTARIYDRNKVVRRKSL